MPSLYVVSVARLVLLYLVITGDTQVDLPLTHKGRDVGCRQEDEGDVEVLDESNVESVFPAELDVGALKKVECGLLQAALWRQVSVQGPRGDGGRFGTEAYFWARRRAVGPLGFAQS